MAVTNTTVLAGVRLNITDVEATADADTTATIPHGLPTTPTIVILTPLAAAARISLWTAAPGAVNTVCTKATTAGSGAAGAQVRVISMAPHSIVS
ncbi:MAG: hypothetical protein AB7T31_16840 [Gemmatimonadales bacterium]